MTTELVVQTVETQDWFIQLVEDCKDIVTETEFTSRWALVDGYHQLGSRILTEYENFQRVRMNDDSLVQRVAISLGKRPRTIYYAVQFAREYPDLNLLPEGKNTNWHRIVNKYLTPGKEKPTITKGDLINILKELKNLFQLEWDRANQGEVFLEHDNCRVRGEFIRYLQDQFTKLTEGLEL